ncbi:hypothetical protein BGZ79_008380 [Entomortierella chlamydospora]|nr:hypothetical protein BGZ79_008380 [Entomortierella chlamydospora]
MALNPRMDIADEMIACLREAVGEANKTKQHAQRLIGQYVERMANGSLEPKDRDFLDALCQRQPKKEDNCRDSDGDDDEPGSWQFLAAFLRYIYSGNYPTDRGVGKLVIGFIGRLQELGMHTPLRERDVIRQSTPFRPGDLVRSVSVQLAVELKKLYRDGVVKLQNQFKDQQKGGRAKVDGSDLDIRSELTAVENFLIFNKMSGNKWKIAPLSTAANGFVSFSESEIVSLCWKRELLKNRILQIVRMTFSSCNSQDDVTRNWLPDKEPEFLLRRLIADVGPIGLTALNRRDVGRRIFNLGDIGWRILIFF